MTLGPDRKGALTMATIFKLAPLGLIPWAVLALTGLLLFG